MGLTKRVCDCTKYPHDPKTERRHVVWDDTVKGFGVRVYPSGRKTFVFRYKLNGRQRWIQLGDYGPMTVQAARKRAMEARVAVNDGNDPAEQRRRRRAQEVTFAEVAAAFIDDKQRKLKPNTVRSYRQILDTHLLPMFGSLRPSAITEEDVQRFHDRMADTPYQANRALHVLGAVMNLAERRGICPGPNPCRNVERYRESARKGYLSAAEFADLGDALCRLETDGAQLESESARVCTISTPAAAALRLLALTGCRVSEILSLQWSDVDEERGLVHLRDAKAGGRSFPLTAPVRDVLASLPRESDWVIPGQRPGEHLTDLAKPWRRACEVAGIDNARLHDLRHSVGAWSASSGDSLLIVGALLGHRSAQSTERYAHLSDNPIRAAAERVASGIAAAMDGKRADVVPMKERQQ